MLSKCFRCTIFRPRINATYKFTSKFAAFASRQYSVVIDPPPLRETSTDVKQFVPRMYQQECCETIMSAFRTHTRIGICIPTGGGKTMILTTIAKQFLEKNKEKKVLIVVYNRDAVSQMVETAQSIMPDAKVSVEAAVRSADPDSNVIVASAHTIRNDNRLEKFNADDFCLVICDEVHRGVAPTFLKVWKHFGCFGDNLSSIPFLGVSATLERHDKVSLSNILDEIVYEKSLNDLISSNYLCDMKLTVVEADQDFGQCLDDKGFDRLIPQIEKILDTPSTHELVYETWRYHSTTENRKATLLFGCNVAHCFNLANHFRAQGTDAEVIIGETSHREREEILARFRAGELPVLIANECLKEAVDLPRTDMVMLLHPTRSKVMVIQMVGRGLRLHPDKKDCHVIDMVNVIQACGGLVSVPTLQGKDLPREKAAAEKKNEEERSKDISLIDPIKVKNLSYETFEGFAEYLKSALRASSHSSIDDPGKTVSLDHLTENNWLNVGNDTYVIQCKERFFQIHRANNKSSESQKIGRIKYLAISWFLEHHFGRIYRRREDIGEGFESLSEAFEYVDEVMREEYHAGGLDRKAPWRLQPITEVEKQRIQRKIKSILKMKKFTGRRLDRDMLNQLNRGQASDITTLQRLRKYDHFYALTKFDDSSRIQT